jgi:hypothetical protein
MPMSVRRSRARRHALGALFAALLFTCALCAPAFANARRGDDHGRGAHF